LEDCTSLSDDEMSNSVVPTAEVSLQLLWLYKDVTFTQHVGDINLS
jgi:hypothetical protein